MSNKKLTISPVTWETADRLVEQLAVLTYNINNVMIKIILYDSVTQ